MVRRYALATTFAAALLAALATPASAGDGRCGGDVNCPPYLSPTVRVADGATVDADPCQALQATCG